MSTSGYQCAHGNDTGRDNLKSRMNYLLSLGHQCSSAHIQPFLLLFKGTDNLRSLAYDLVVIISYLAVVFKRIRSSICVVLVSVNFSLGPGAFRAGPSLVMRVSFGNGVEPSLSPNVCRDRVVSEDVGG